MRSTVPLLLLAGACLFPGLNLPAAQTDELKDLEGLKLIPDNVSLLPASAYWTQVINVSAGLGYRDNITLSPFAPAGSGFFALGLQAMAVQLPRNDWQFTLFFDGEDIRYFRPVQDVDHEDTVLALAEARKDLGPDWQFSTALQYVFVDQVQDVSLSEADTAQARVIGQILTLRPGVRWNLGQSNWWLQLEIPLVREWMQAPLDSAWQIGPKLMLRHPLGSRSELRLTYMTFWQPYDNRTQSDTLGNDIPDTHLAFWQQRAELAWDYYWDARQRWRASTGVGFDLNHDNGAGYFDYRTYRLSEQLRYRAGTFEARLRISAGYRDFLVRTVDDAGDTGVHQSLWNVNVHLEKGLASFLKVYAEYDYDRSLSNQDFEEYHVNTIRGGVTWEF